MNRPVCRYEPDMYGRPRVLSRWEAVLHSIARPVVVAVVIGYGLAILLIATQHAQKFVPTTKTTQSHIESKEIES